MNPITGEYQIEIGGNIYWLRFTWRAISEIEAKYGEKPNLFDPEVIAYIAAAGLKAKHPEMTAEKILDLSPPLVPFAQAIQQALQWAYFGKSIMPPEKSEEIKKNQAFHWLKKFFG